MLYMDRNRLPGEPYKNSNPVLVQGILACKRDLKVEGWANFTEKYEFRRV